MRSHVMTVGPLGKILDAVLDYKPGTGFYIIGALVLFFGGILTVTYLTEGEINLGRLFGTSQSENPFWGRNPHFEKVDTYTKTSFYEVRDRASGRTAMLDLASLDTAEIKPRPCEMLALPKEIDYPGATDRICYEMNKPDTGSGHLYVGAISFTAKAKSTQVAAFYRAQFVKRGYSVLAIVEDPGRAIVLEAEDKGNTVARISVGHRGDVAFGFFVWTKDFR